MWRVAFILSGVSQRTKSTSRDFDETDMKCGNISEAKEAYSMAIFRVTGPSNL